MIGFVEIGSDLYGLTMKWNYDTVTQLALVFVVSGLEVNVVGASHKNGFSDEV